MSQEKDNTKTYVILLRGVMPFGKNKVPMAVLRVLLTQAGLKNVQTYIQTGNVIAESNLNENQLEQMVHDIIQENLGGDITVTVRDYAQFKKILQDNPFDDVDNSRLYFTILASLPDDDVLNNFLSTDFSPDHVMVSGDVIYTLYKTKYSDSKFNNNFFERKLQVRATTRNFNTMNKLLQLGKG